MKGWIMGFISAAVAVAATASSAAGSLPVAEEDLASMRARANLHTIARFALVFNAVEGRDPSSLEELLSVPYSPFPDGYFENPYTGGPLKEHSAEAIWSALEAAGAVTLSEGRRQFVEGIVPNEGPSALPYGTVTAIPAGGRTKWALITDPDGTRTRARVLFWAHPPEDRGTADRPEAPLSPADYRARLHLARVKSWVLTYRKWFSWVKDPAERRIIFLCSEMQQTIERYQRERLRRSDFQPAQWEEALQYAYDHGWIKLVNPVNPYTGREMMLVSYAERSEGNFWIFDRLPERADPVSLDPRPVKLPVLFCYGKPPNILYPAPGLLWDMLWRMGELQYPAPPQWWLNSAK